MFFVHLNTKIHHTNSKLQVNMEKIIFIMLLGLVCNTINAQIVTKQELEEYTNIGICLGQLRLRSYLMNIS